MIINFDTLEDRIFNSKYENLCSYFEDYDKELILNYKCHPYFRTRKDFQNGYVELYIFYFPGKVFDGTLDGEIDIVIRRINPNFVGEVYIIEALIQYKTRRNPPPFLLTNRISMFFNGLFNWVNYSFFNGEEGEGFIEMLSAEPIRYLKLEDKAGWENGLIKVNSRICAFVAFPVGFPRELKRIEYNILRNLITSFLNKILVPQSSKIYT